MILLGKRKYNQMRRSGVFRDSIFFFAENRLIPVMPIQFITAAAIMAR